MNIAIQFLEKELSVKVVGCNPQDIVSGNVKQIMGILFLLMQHCKKIELKITEIDDSFPVVEENLPKDHRDISNLINDPIPQSSQHSSLLKKFASSSLDLIEVPKESESFEKNLKIQQIADFQNKEKILRKIKSEKFEKIKHGSGNQNLPQEKNILKKIFENKKSKKEIQNEKNAQEIPHHTDVIISPKNESVPHKIEINASKVEEFSVKIETNIQKQVNQNKQQENLEKQAKIEEKSEKKDICKPEDIQGQPQKQETLKIRRENTENDFADNEKEADSESEWKVRTGAGRGKPKVGSMKIPKKKIRKIISEMEEEENPPTANEDTEEPNTEAKPSSKPPATQSIPENPSENLKQTEKANEAGKKAEKVEMEREEGINQDSEVFYEETEENKLIRKKIATEILESEEKYVSGLKKLKKHYLIPLRKDKIIEENSIKKIFSTIELLINFHDKLLKILQKRIHGGRWERKKEMIGDIFLTIEIEYLKMYTIYVNNYNHAISEVEKLKKKNKQFLLFLEEKNLLNKKCKKSKRNSRRGVDTSGDALEEEGSLLLDIYSYLIMPIQRIPRYIMLLNDLFLVTPYFHLDFKYLKLSIKKMKEIACFLNEKKRQAENLNIVFLIQNLLGIKFDLLIQNSRKFIRCGPCYDISSPDELKIPSFFFLFSDSLIIATFSSKKGISFPFSFPSIFPPPIPSFLSLPASFRNAFLSPLSCLLPSPRSFLFPLFYLSFFPFLFLIAFAIPFVFFPVPFSSSILFPFFPYPFVILLCT